MSIPSIAITIHNSVPSLNAQNWSQWSLAMQMFFQSASASHIFSDSPPSSSDAKYASWTSLDSQLLPFIFAKLDQDYWYLLDGVTSARVLWDKVKALFEKSTIGHRMLARQKFYGVSHDISKPITIFIQEVIGGASQLKTLGCTVEDTEVIDVILMNLDPSFHPIRTTILAQDDYSTLEKLKTILSSATSADGLGPGSFTSQSAFAASSGKKRHPLYTTHSRPPHSSHYSSTSHHPNHSGHPISRVPSPVDSKGFRWCNPTNEGHCHRCGREGHIAARCVYNMPQEVKDWVFANSRQNSHPSQQRANAVYHFLSSPHHSPSNSPPLSPQMASGAFVDYSAMPPLLI